MKKRRKRLSTTGALKSMEFNLVIQLMDGYQNIVNLIGKHKLHRIYQTKTPEQRLMELE